MYGVVVKCFVKGGFAHLHWKLLAFFFSSPLPQQVIGIQLGLGKVR